MTTQQFELRRRIIANMLVAIMKEIDQLQVPEERAYFEPLYEDAQKHLNDIKIQLIKEGRMRLYA
ncbi:MAG: hypothetical protein QXS81_01060 [Candidatus Micrarchaeaceae archaeon]